MVLRLLTTSVLIIGGGVSGLVTAHRLTVSRPTVEVLVAEGASRPGGVMRSDQVSGFVLEWGPNGFLGNVPQTPALVGELGLQGRLLKASSDAKKRYLFKDGRLTPVPSSPVGFMMTPLLSFKGRWRTLAEPFQPPGAADDESVAAFGRRRLGPEATSTFLDPLVTGVFGGDVERLSLPSAFPRIAKLEKDHGSLLRGMLAQAKHARREKRTAKVVKVPNGGNGNPQRDNLYKVGTSGSAVVQSGLSQARSGSDGVLPRVERRALYSFHSGMEELVTALHSRLGERVHVDRSVESVHRVGDRFQATLHGGESVEARAVVVATPTGRAASLLSGEFPELAGELEQIPYAGLAVVCLGYRREDVEHPLDGFGFLAPRGQGLRILGAIWVSTIFPRHAPPGTVSLRVMVGGAHDPDVLGKTADELVELTKGELEPILGLRGEPLVSKVYRHPLGIPQYNLGHAKRLQGLETRVGEIPGFFLAGNAHRGVGVNDCVANGERLAHRIQAFLGGVHTV